MMVDNVGKRWLRRSVLLLLLYQLLGCATKPVDIQTVESHNVDFSRYRTFYILPEPPNKNNVRRPQSFPRQVVESAVRRELLARNYQEIHKKENADLLLAIQFSLTDETRLRNVVDYEYQYEDYGYGYGYGYGYRRYYGYRVIPHTSVEVQHLRQGNMVIDIIDREENALVWEAFAQGSGERKMDKIQRRINSVVAQIFGHYPYVANRDRGGDQH